MGKQQLVQVIQQKRKWKQAPFGNMRLDFLHNKRNYSGYHLSAYLISATMYTLQDSTTNAAI